VTLFWAQHPGSRVLVLAPHPDDESLATGGLLQKVSDAGGECRVIFLTDGENNPWPQRVIERRWRIKTTDKERWGCRRRLEATSALAELGVSESVAAFWGFPDQGLTGLLLAAGDELTDRLARELDEWRPSVLVTPSSLDLHPDHSAVAVFARLALASRKSMSVDPLHIEYRVHGRGPDRIAPCLILTLSEEQQDRKRRAILRHTSQLRLRHNLVEFARGAEKFISSEEMRNLRYHPVSNASASAGEITLDLKLSPRAGAFGRATLYLASYLQGYPAQVLAMTLHRGRAALIDVMNAVNGDVVAHARLLGERGCFKLQIPLSVLASADFVCAKVERRFGFFDEAGWCALPVNPKRGGK
jgi:LmbE family N-acetylglucosaminyl deacetylase